MSHQMRGRTRRLLHQQLPPGAPPDFVPPARPQPLPKVNKLAQVFSTFEVLPVAGRMFAQSMTESGTVSGGITTWLFDMPPTPQGWVRILRGVVLHPGLRTNVGTTGRTHYRIAADGQMWFQLRLNRMPPPDVNDLDGAAPALAMHGQYWPVYLLTVGGDIPGLKVTAEPEWAPGYNELQATFYGDMLKARNLPREMEIGHEAAVVKLAPGQAEDYE